MDQLLLATTRNAELQPLGAGGHLAPQVWQQLSGHLARAFGPRHAALLAEPQPDPSRGVTDWYGPPGRRAARLEELPEAEREAARAGLAALIADIQAEVARLRASRGEGERLLGELLDLALVLPSADSLRIVDGQPVLIAWGHAPVGEAPRRELLLGQLRRPARAAPPPAPALPPMAIVGPPPPPPRRFPWAWLAALLLLLLLLLLLWLVWRDPYGWFRREPGLCTIPPAELELAERLREAQDREARLRGQIAEEIARLGQRRLQCPPPPRPEPPRPAPRPAETRPPAAAQPDPAEQQRHRDAERAREQGARSGRIQIILAWDDVNDLDLSVVCPNGERIYFGRERACGGVLDVDRNAGTWGPTPVENIVFEAEPAPGTYRIEVHHFARNPGGPAVSPWRVTLRRQGRPDQSFSGTVAVGQRVTVTTFTSP